MLTPRMNLAAIELNELQEEYTLEEIAQLIAIRQVHALENLAAHVEQLVYK